MKGSHLAIQIADYGVRFSSIRNDEIIETLDFAFIGSDISSKKEQLESHLEESRLTDKEFDEVILSWSCNKSTIVPNNIFSESSAQSIYELCYGKDTDTHSIDYNRIAELSVINVFEFPSWIKQFFVIKFPRIVLQHEGSHLLRKVMNQSTFKLKATVVLYNGYFQLTIVKHGDLEFYSFFDYQNFEDVLYHVLFTLQQKELTEEIGSVEFIQGIGSDNKVYQDVIDNVQRVRDLNKLKTVVYSDFIEKAQLLCV